MNENAMLTGKPSIDRPWMKFYPDVLRGIQVPACTVEQYLSVRAADPNVIAMHYYGVDITWGTVFRKVDATARALQVLGVKQGDQIPVFLRSVPEFIYLLLAAERIGASLLCRDNTLEENIEAVQKANAKVAKYMRSIKISQKAMAGAMRTSNPANKARSSAEMDAVRPMIDAARAKLIGTAMPTAGDIDISAEINAERNRTV